jgi:hypothetical protein
VKTIPAFYAAVIRIVPFASHFAAIIRSPRHECSKRTHKRARQ